MNEKRFDYPPPEPVRSPSATETHRLLSQCTALLYKEMLYLCLSDGTATVLYSEGEKQTGKTYRWDEYLSFWSEIHLKAEDRERMRAHYSYDRVREQLSGREWETLDLTYFPENENGSPEHVTTLLCREDGNPDEACLIVRAMEEGYLLRSIVNRYVYSHCDYFIYLDAVEDSYVMLSASKSGTPLPAAQSSNYTREMERYVGQAVVPEDRNRVVFEMSLPRMFEMLEKRELYSFAYGVIDPKRGYTRKRMEYCYHDRGRQMMMLTRTDITASYFEDKRHTEELQRALLRAQTDSLTGLSNYQSTVDKISARLREGRSNYAFFFLDLDNFKRVNDTLGHAFGDRFVQEVALVLRRNGGHLDVAGRVGGDEFVFFTDRADSEEEVRELAEKLCREIGGISLPGVSMGGRGQSLISCSIGVALAPRHGNSYQVLATYADKMAYRAKAEGKNRYFME